MRKLFKRSKLKFKKVSVLVAIMIFAVLTGGASVYAAYEYGVLEWKGEDQLARGEALVTKLVTDIVSLESQRASLQSRVNDLETNGNAADQATIDSLNSQINSLTSQISQLGTDLSNAESEIARLASELILANRAAEEFQTVVCTEIAKLPNGIYVNGDYGQFCPVE